MLSPEGIRIAKVGVVKMTTFIEPVPEEMPLIGGEETVYLLLKWHHRDQEEKIILREVQETLMGDILKLQATVGRGGRDKKIEDYVGIVYDSIR